MRKKSLAETHPEIAKQWHPSKNGDLTPYDITPGSSKKVWWKCPKGDDHEYSSIVAGRTRGRKCPICTGNKVVKSNSLGTLNPELAKEWHPSKNGDLTAYDITPGSSKKVWWKCPKGDDHEWETSPNHRKYQGCSICAGKKVVKSNSFGTLNSELAKEWHPLKNGDLTPYDVLPNSHKKVWWKCRKGDDHEWLSQVSSRFRGSKCPICTGNKVVKSNSLGTLNPELAKEWHPSKNGDLTPYDVLPNSNKKVWWKCLKDDDHKWKAYIYSRNEGKGCPICTPGGFDTKQEGYLYTHIIYHESGKKIALKFGITNKYGVRIKDLQKGLKLYKIKNIFYFRGDGKTVQNLEFEIFKKYNNGYITNEIMKYGFTETIKYSDKILVEIYNLCNKKLKFKSGKKLHMKRLLNIFN